MSFRRSGFSCLTPKLLVLSVAILLGFGTTAAWSQATSTATLAGLVTDEQNAAVAGRRSPHRGIRRPAASRQH